MCTICQHLRDEEWHLYGYIYIKQLLKAQETGEFLTLGKRMREVGDGVGWRLTFHSTPFCTVLFFYMYMLSPTKVIFERWVASVPDFFINYMCDLVQSLTSIFSALKWDYTKSLESHLQFNRIMAQKKVYTKCQVAK